MSFVLYFYKKVKGFEPDPRPNNIKIRFNKSLPLGFNP